MSGPDHRRQPAASRLRPARGARSATASRMVDGQRVAVGRGQLDQEQRMPPAASVQLGRPVGAHDGRGGIDIERTQRDGRDPRDRDQPSARCCPTTTTFAAGEALRRLAQPHGGGGVGQVDVADDQHERGSWRDWRRRTLKSAANSRAWPASGSVRAAIWAGYTGSD